MSSNTTINVVTRKLKKLDNLTSGEAVAIALRDMGIKGYRTSAARCPIANYTIANTKLNWVGTVPEYSRLYVRGTDNWGHDYLRTVAKIPHKKGGPIARFIREFDDGKYPFLVEGYDSVE